MNPTEITLHSQSKVLELTFNDGSNYKFPFEFLRVYSPSAEVRGHGPGQETLQVGKRNVAITEIKPSGSYAINIVFDDGHDSGLYTWEYLVDMGKNQAAMWDAYLEQIKAAGASRDAK